MPCRRPSHTTRRGTTAVSRQGTKSICVRKGFEFETEARSLGMDKRPGSFRTNCSRPHRNRPRYELVVNQKTAGVPQKSRFPGAGVPLPGTSLPVCPTEGARAPVNRLLGRDGCRPRPGTSEASASCFGCQITPVYWPGGGFTWVFNPPNQYSPAENRRLAPVGGQTGDKFGALFSRGHGERGRRLRHRDDHHHRVGGRLKAGIGFGVCFGLSDAAIALKTVVSLGFSRCPDGRISPARPVDVAELGARAADFAPTSARSAAAPCEPMVRVEIIIVTGRLA
jgi:hypothetical protein